MVLSISANRTNNSQHILFLLGATLAAPRQATTATDRRLDAKTL